MFGLIIDTSRDPAILGLVKGAQVEKIALIDGAKNLSAKLFPKLQSFCKIKDLNYIAIGIGPGSYMGIRTGATIAKTLAYASSLPLIEFSSPLAFLPPERYGEFAFVGDAKMGQLYVLTGNTQDRSISSPLLLSPEELPLHLGGKHFIVGPGHLDLTPNLNWVAAEVSSRFLQNKFSNVASLELTYLR